jgi:hypothetical protein
MIEPLPIEPAWAETAFAVVNNAVLPGWIILFGFPRWKHGAWLVSGVIIPGLLAVAYLALVVASSSQPNAAGPEAFFTLQGIMTLFDNPVGVVAGWTHYLVFDLAIGSWEVRDAQAHGIPHKWVVPCLFFTLMLGPVGFLMYLVLRSRWLGKITLEV